VWLGVDLTTHNKNNMSSKEIKLHAQHVLTIPCSIASMLCGDSTLNGSNKSNFEKNNNKGGAQNVPYIVARFSYHIPKSPKNVVSETQVHNDVKQQKLTV